MLLEKLLIKDAIAQKERDPICDRSFFTVMSYRALIQPFKDKCWPNWTVAESMINEPYEPWLWVWLAQTSSPRPLLLSVIVYIECDTWKCTVYEILGTPPAMGSSHSAQIELNLTDFFKKIHSENKLNTKSYWHFPVSIIKPFCIFVVHYTGRSHILYHLT